MDVNPPDDDEDDIVRARQEMKRPCTKAEGELEVAI
jgi:hypothetical protein